MTNYSLTLLTALILTRVFILHDVQLLGAVRSQPGQSVLSLWALFSSQRDRLNKGEEATESSFWTPKMER